MIQNITDRAVFMKEQVVKDVKTLATIIGDKIQNPRVSLTDEKTSQLGYAIFRLLITAALSINVISFLATSFSALTIGGAILSVAEDIVFLDLFKMLANDENPAESLTFTDARKTGASIAKNVFDSLISPKSAEKSTLKIRADIAVSGTLLKPLWKQVSYKLIDGAGYASKNLNKLAGKLTKS